MAFGSSTGQRISHLICGGPTSTFAVLLNISSMLSVVVYSGVFVCASADLYVYISVVEDMKSPAKAPSSSRNDTMSDK